MQGPLQGSKAGHTGIPQAVKVEHPGHRKVDHRTYEQLKEVSELWAWSLMYSPRHWIPAFAGMTEYCLYRDSRPKVGFQTTSKASQGRHLHAQLRRHFADFIPSGLGQINAFDQ